MVTTTSGGFTGVETVVDKDLCAALLAEEISAEALLLLTDVPACSFDARQDSIAALGS